MSHVCFLYRAHPQIGWEMQTVETCDRFLCMFASCRNIIILANSAGIWCQDCENLKGDLLDSILQYREGEVDDTHFELNGTTKMCDFVSGPHHPRGGVGDELPCGASLLRSARSFLAMWASVAQSCWRQLRSLSSDDRKHHFRTMRSECNNPAMRALELAAPRR